MRTKMYVLCAVAMFAVGWAPAVTSDDDIPQPDPIADALCQEIDDGEGVFDAVHTIPWPLPGDPLATMTTHAYCFDETIMENLDTDCTATSYSLTGWRWVTPYSGQVDTTNSYGFSSATVTSNFNAGSNTWDNAVAADIFGSIVAGGSSSNIRRQDFVNQHGWKNLGGGGTIAVTYTWAYQDGRAAESDAAYNTFYPWSVTGQAGKMDLLNIQTHEIGHTFGMGHSSSAGVNSCLTMYPSGTYGETQKRTLGDGDLLGIDARY